MAKILQRKQRLNQGTTDRNGITTVYADSAGGLRKIRCPRGCQGFATPTTQADSKNRFVCPACGTNFTCVQM